MSIWFTEDIELKAKISGAEKDLENIQLWLTEKTILQFISEKNSVRSVS